MNTHVFPILFIITGAGMLVIWTKDILTNPDIDTSGGILKARDKDSGNLFWPHWLAEYTTAISLIAASFLLFLNSETGTELLLFAVGALFYTSLNSLGWAFARKERIAYAFPMIFGLCVSIIYCLIQFFN